MAVDTRAGLPGPSEDLSIVDVPQLEQKLLNTSKEISSTLKNYVSSCLSAPHVSTVELQWLELLWNHENMFETGVVRANKC